MVDDVIWKLIHFFIACMFYKNSLHLLIRTLLFAPNYDYVL